MPNFPLAILPTSSKSALYFSLQSNIVDRCFWLPSWLLVLHCELLITTFQGRQNWGVADYGHHNTTLPPCFQTFHRLWIFMSCKRILVPTICYEKLANQGRRNVLMNIIFWQISSPYSNQVGHIMPAHHINLSPRNFWTIRWPWLS